MKKNTTLRDAITGDISDILSFLIEPPTTQNNKEYETVLPEIQAGEIPEHPLSHYLTEKNDMLISVLGIMANGKIREGCCNRGMFAFVSKDWTKPLAQWIGKRKVLEIMAGCGWLAKALRDDDIDIIATDNLSWHDHKGSKWNNVTEVVEMDYMDAILEHGKDRDILIISWPYMDNKAYEAIKIYHDVNPEGLVIYIGESRTGCTADEEFFDHYDVINEDLEFAQIAQRFQSFSTIHDNLYLGNFKKSRYEERKKL